MEKQQKTDVKILYQKFDKILFQCYIKKDVISLSYKRSANSTSLAFGFRLEDPM